VVAIEKNITYQNSQRFQITSLPFWYLCSTKIEIDQIQGSGCGFANSKELARQKSHSEALERWVFAKWKQTEISPFTGEIIAPPKTTTGMAAHTNPEISNQHALNEWIERFMIVALANHTIQLTVTSIPNNGWWFRESIVYLFRDVKVFFVKHGDMFFGWTVIWLKTGGVIFGSSVKDNKIQAVQTSLEECIRKTAFLESWKNGPFIFKEKLLFWLSREGEEKMEQILQHSSKNSYENFVLPIDQSKIMQFKIQNHWVSFYNGGESELTQLFDKEIPLL